MIFFQPYPQPSFDDPSHYITLAREALINNNLSNMTSLLSNNYIQANARLKRTLDSKTAKPLLSIAVKQGHLKMVELLIKYGAAMETKDGDRPPIYAAIKKQNKEIVDYLLNHGAKANGNYSKKNSKVLMTFLGKAAIKGNIPIVTSLIDRGAKVSQAIHSLELQYPFKVHQLSGAELEEAQNKYLNAIKLLLDHAAGVDLKSLGFVKKMNVLGYSFFAVSLNGIPISRQTLKEYGAYKSKRSIISLEDLEKLRENRRSIIKNRMQRCANKRGLLTYPDREVVNLVPFRALIEHGTPKEIRLRLDFKCKLKKCDLNKYSNKDNHQLTRFHQFILRGETDLVKLCLTHRADLNLNATYNNRTMTCIELARQQGCFDVSAYLDLYLDYKNNPTAAAEKRLRSH